MKVIWYSLGSAAVTGAAQLAVAQAIGIVRWSDGGGDAAGWGALLTWVAFIFAIAVLGGASVGRRALRRPGRKESFGVRLVAALAAVVGAAGAATLAWLPARTMPPPVNGDPELVIVITAAAGIVVGFLVALVALSLAPVAGGVRATVTWIWLVGLGSAIAGYVSHQPYRAPRLGVIDAPSVVPVNFWTGPNLMVAITLLLSITLAVVARWGGSHRAGVALSGLAGPALAAAAYLVAGPGTGADRSTQFEPYLAALIAMAAGFIASLLVALPGRGLYEKQREPAPRTEVYEDLLPTTPAEPEPAPAYGQPAYGQPAYGQLPYGQPRYEESYTDWLNAAAPATNDHR